MTVLQKIDKAKAQILDFYQNHDDLARGWKRQGRRIFGYLCSYVPEEILWAADILPVRILGHLDSLQQAEAHFQPFVCRLIRSSLDKGLRGTLDYLDGIVVPYTCDGMRMLYDAWVAHVPKHVAYLLDLPSALASESNKRYFYRAQEEFRRSIERYVGHSIEEERLNASIKVYNRYRKLAKRFYALRLQHRLPITGSEAMKIYLAALMSPKSEYNERLSALLELFEEWVGSGEEHRPGAVRVHISGSVVVDPLFFELIDQVGGEVVSDDLCTGTRYYWDLVDEREEPFRAVSERYLNRVACPTKYPAANRPGFLLDRLQESRAKGVIFILEKYCDPHLFDYPALRQALEAEGVATLWLETELVASGTEQLRTRLETFMDMLRRK
jgi:benzoyl-CoA reductase subunit C